MKVRKEMELYNLNPKVQGHIAFSQLQAQVSTVDHFYGG